MIYTHTMNTKPWFWLILLLGGAVACQPNPPHPADEAVLDTWQAVVATDSVSVERIMVIQGPWVNLLRGSPALTPEQLEVRLNTTGAAQASCQIDDDYSLMTITCRYQQPLLSTDGVVHHASLPDDALLSFLMGLPIEQAVAVRVEMEGEVVVPGVLASIPSLVNLHTTQGNQLVRRYTLGSLSRLLVSGAWVLAPGALPTPQDTSGVRVAFIPRYAPRPSAWLAWSAGLLLSLLAMACVFPVHLHRQLAPGVWDPDLSSLPAWIRWLGRWLVALVNWWHRTWPALFNTSLGLSLTASGAISGYLGWRLTRLVDTVEEWDATLQLWLDQAGGLVAALPSKWLLWAGWPWVVVLAAVSLMLLGLGLLTYRNPARLVVMGLCLAWLFSIILVWPHLLLAPSLASQQLKFVLSLGLLWLAAPTGLAYGLQHPRLRRRYEGEEVE